MPYSIAVSFSEESTLVGNGTHADDDSTGMSSLSRTQCDVLNELLLDADTRSELVEIAELCQSIIGLLPQDDRGLADTSTDDAALSVEEFYIWDRYELHTRVIIIR